MLSPENVIQTPGGGTGPRGLCSRPPRCEAQPQTWPGDGEVSVFQQMKHVTRFPPLRGVALSKHGSPFGAETRHWPGMISIKRRESGAISLHVTGGHRPPLPCGLRTALVTLKNRY